MVDTKQGVSVCWDSHGSCGPHSTTQCRSRTSEIPWAESDIISLYRRRLLPSRRRAAWAARSARVCRSAPRDERRYESPALPGRSKRVREYLVDPALKERAERPMLPRLLEEARRHYFEVLVVVFPWCLHRDSQVRSQIRKRLQGHRIDLVILRNEK